jgi:hypothetical protein
MTQRTKMFNFMKAHWKEVDSGADLRNRMAFQASQRDPANKRRFPERAPVK